MAFPLEVDLNLSPGINGEFGLVFGTSASSPVVASLITLVNDARIARGKRPVGFINPAVSDHTLVLSSTTTSLPVDLLSEVQRCLQRHYDWR
jgi:hypothetical protein